jgi:hypothetical protein
MPDAPESDGITPSIDQKTFDRAWKDYEKESVRFQRLTVEHYRFQGQRLYWFRRTASWRYLGASKWPEFLRQLENLGYVSQSRAKQLVVWWERLEAAAAVAGVDLAAIDDLPSEASVRAMLKGLGEERTSAALAVALETGVPLETVELGTLPVPEPEESAEPAPPDEATPSDEARALEPNIRGEEGRPVPDQPAEATGQQKLALAERFAARHTRVGLSLDKALDLANLFYRQDRVADPQLWIDVVVGVLHPLGFLGQAWTAPYLDEDQEAPAAEEDAP